MKIVVEFKRNLKIKLPFNVYNGQRFDVIKTKSFNTITLNINNTYVDVPIDTVNFFQVYDSYRTNKDLNEIIVIDDDLFKI